MNTQDVKVIRDIKEQIVWKALENTVPTITLIPTGDTMASRTDAGPPSPITSQPPWNPPVHTHHLRALAPAVTPSVFRLTVSLSLFHSWFQCYLLVLSSLNMVSSWLPPPLPTLRESLSITLLLFLHTIHNYLTYFTWFICLSQTSPLG